eukprot:jgi/Ulvmu1/4206/UM019_0185.1
MSKVDSSVTPNQRGYYDVGKGIKGVRTDDGLAKAIMERNHDTVFVKYGLPWCKSCQAVLPEWVKMTQEFDQMDYVIASVENMKEAVKDIHYTPHFAVFRKGRLVDEFHGTDLQRLRDRMWLHNED